MTHHHLYTNSYIGNNSYSYQLKLNIRINSRIIIIPAIFLISYALFLKLFQHNVHMYIYDLEILKEVPIRPASIIAMPA